MSPLPQEGNPPPLDFEDIDTLLMNKLIELEAACDRHNISKGNQIEQTQLIILGAIKEILQKLASLHPKQVIQVAGKLS